MKLSKLNRMGILTLTVLMAVAIGMPLHAQTSDFIAQADNEKLVVMNAQPNSDMVVTGTSTIHDWEVEVKDYSAQVELSEPLSETGLSNIGAALSSATITVPVKNMDSGKGGMNRKMYGALKKDDHPDIVFSLDSAEVTASSDTSNAVSLNTKGNLSMAGSEQPIEMMVNVERLEDGTLKFSGEKKLNMKDFDIDPPSAVFGTIKAGEEVTVKFDLIAGR